MRCSVCAEPMRKIGETFALFGGVAQRWRCDRSLRRDDEIELTVECTLDQPLHKISCTITVNE